MTLVFDADQHEYTLDGEALPSVTQVLHSCGMLPDYSLLDPFYRERGRKIHAAIQLDLKGDLDLESVDADVGVYLARFWRFAEAVNLQPVWVEGPLHCPVYRYAGTADVLARDDRGLIVYDWKRGDFEPGHALQVAGGYLPLLEAGVRAGVVPVSLEDLARARVAVVPLTNDLPAPVWIPRGNHRDLFRAALAVHGWRTTHMKGRHGRRTALAA